MEKGGFLIKSSEKLISVVIIVIFFKGEYREGI